MAVAEWSCSACWVFPDLRRYGTINGVSDTSSPRLLRRLLWREPMLWIWLVSLPLGYGVVFWLAEGGGPLSRNSNEEWARTVALFLLAWSVVVIGSGVLGRLAGRRVEARLTRLINGG